MLHMEEAEGHIALSFTPNMVNFMNADVMSLFQGRARHPMIKLFELYF